MIQNVYLVEIYHEDGSYYKTTQLAFTSIAAAEKYAKDCDFKTKIVKVSLVSLANF